MSLSDYLMSYQDTRFFFGGGVWIDTVSVFCSLSQLGHEIFECLPRYRLAICPAIIQLNLKRRTASRNKSKIDKRNGKLKTKNMKIRGTVGYWSLVIDQSLTFFVLFTNPSARAGYDTRSIFKRSLTGLNSEFSFS